MLINLRCGFRSLNCTKRITECRQKSQSASRRNTENTPPLPLPLSLTHSASLDCHNTWSRAIKDPLASPLLCVLLA